MYQATQIGQVERHPPNPPSGQASDYPNVLYWFRNAWTDHCKQLKDQNQTINKLGFLCDASGQPLPEHRLEATSKSAANAWNSLYFEHLDPETWSKKIDQALQYFSATMRLKYSEFCLCDGDWKLQEFATHCFPVWNRYCCQSGKLKCGHPLFPFDSYNAIHFFKAEFLPPQRESLRSTSKMPPKLQKSAESKNCIVKLLT
jgi:hypothetical protein